MCLNKGYSIWFQTVQEHFLILHCFDASLLQRFFSFVSLEMLLSVPIGMLYASVTACIYPTYSQNYMRGKQYSKPNSGKTSYFANDST